jgi:hypothetical protein
VAHLRLTYEDQCFTCKLPRLTRKDITYTCSMVCVVTSFCVVIYLFETFFSPQMILRIYIFSKLSITCTSALSFVSSQFCAKQRRIDIKRFSMLVLVSTSYMHITFCFIVSMNRLIGKIQITAIQPFCNLTYCNTLLFLCCSMYGLFCIILCTFVLYYCYRVSTQLQLTNR